MFNMNNRYPYTVFADRLQDAADCIGAPESSKFCAGIAVGYAIALNTPGDEKLLALFQLVIKQQREKAGVV